MRTYVPATLLLLLASCVSGPSRSYAPLEPIRKVDVSYRAELAPGATRDLQAGDSASGAGVPAAATAPEVTMQASFMRFDPRVESDLFGGRSVDGRVLDANTFRLLCMECERDGTLDVLSSPSLSVETGGRAFVSLLSQTAYIRSFELTANDTSLVADPQIDVASEGLLLHGVPRGGAREDTIELDLDLRSCQLERPIRVVDARVPGLAAQVSMQVPLTFVQHLTTSVVLARGEVLVLRGLVDAEGRSILTCVGGEPAGASKLASAH